jgi:hypothetical protein
VAGHDFEDEADPASENLLALDGYVFFIDERGEYWVKFEVQRVEPSPERPHGIKYSLTLHDSSKRRLIGFDNSHPAKSAAMGRRGRPLDHQHRLGQSRRPYRYRSAVRLLDDFWEAVDQVLKERGVRP